MWSDINPDIGSLDESLVSTKPSEKKKVDTETLFGLMKKIEDSFKDKSQDEILEKQKIAFRLISSYLYSDRKYLAVDYGARFTKEIGGLLGNGGSIKDKLKQLLTLV